MPRIIQNEIARGRCVIPCDNIKQYAKVTKRLTKDGIEWSEAQEDSTYMAMVYIKPPVDRIEFRPVTAPCIIITYDMPKTIWDSL